jgi:hypothetical protein
MARHLQKDYGNTSNSGANERTNAISWTMILIGYGVLADELRLPIKRDATEHTVHPYGYIPWYIPTVCTYRTYSTIL